MNYKRKIRFQYYQIKSIEAVKGAKHKIFDIATWAKIMKDNKMIKKAHDFNNATARIERINFNKTNKLWGIKLLKLRDTNIPSKVKEYEDAEVIELEDNEYIGEDLVFIYDAEKGIAMIQQNRMALMVSRIEEFLESTYNQFMDADSKISITIDAILSTDGAKKVKKGKHRTLEISFANLNEFVPTPRNKSLATILNPLKNLYGVSGNIKVGLGHSGTDTLNRTQILSLINELDSNKRYVRSARVKVKEADDTDVEIIDLFEDVTHDFIEFTLKLRAALDYQTTITAMTTKYSEKKRTLYTSVNPIGK